MAIRLACLICTWMVLGTLPSLPFLLLFISLFLLYVIYFIIFYSLLFLLFYLEWTQNVCWPRLTYKRVEPVVSISWASCCILCLCIVTVVLLFYLAIWATTSLNTLHFTSVQQCNVYWKCVLYRRCPRHTFTRCCRASMTICLYQSLKSTLPASYVCLCFSLSLS